MQEKFGMTLTAIYSFVSKNAIPKKKVGIMVYYSKKHVDIAKGLIAPEEPKYYTIAEAMERFNLTRDQLYHYVKYHNIPRIKVGKYTKILRAELDKFFEPPKIEWAESYFPVINTTIRTPILFATKQVLIKNNIAMTLTCTNVTLRQKPLRNDRISLYLDYYPAIRNPYTMKMSRREFLGIYIYAKPKNEQQRMFNQDMLNKAEAIRCIRVQSLINEEFGFLDKNKQR